MKIWMVFEGVNGDKLDSVSVTPFASEESAKKHLETSAKAAAEAGERDWVVWIEEAEVQP